jgi:hypothetical protein
LHGAFPSPPVSCPASAQVLPIHIPETQSGSFSLTIRSGKPSLTAIFKQSRTGPPYALAIRGQKSRGETGNGSQVKQG